MLFILEYFITCKLPDFIKMEHENSNEPHYFSWTQPWFYSLVILAEYVTCFISNTFATIIPPVFDFRLGA